METLSNFIQAKQITIGQTIIISILTGLFASWVVLRVGTPRIEKRIKKSEKNRWEKVVGYFVKEGLEIYMSLVANIASSLNLELNYQPNVTNILKGHSTQATFEILKNQIKVLREYLKNKPSESLNLADVKEFTYLSRGRIDNFITKSFTFHIIDEPKILENIYALTEAMDTLSMAIFMLAPLANDKEPKEMLAWAVNSYVLKITNNCEQFLKIKDVCNLVKANKKLY